MRSPDGSLQLEDKGEGELEVVGKTHTSSLDVDEVYVVSCGVHHGPKGHRISNLPVEPDVLVDREKEA